MIEEAEEYEYEGDYDRRIINEAQDKEIFVSAVAFSRDGFQLEYMHRDKQNENTIVGETMVLRAVSELQQQAYYEMQSICENLIVEALIELRNKDQ